VKYNSKRDELAEVMIVKYLMGLGRIF